MNDKPDTITGNFLAASDLMDSGGVKLTITAVAKKGTEKTADGKTIDKRILSFQETPVRMVIGSTIEKCIAADHGSKTPGWVGKQIRVEVRYLKLAFGQPNVPTLRVIPVKPVPMGARKHMGQREPYGDNPDDNSPRPEIWQ